jgi:hypothetical protein
MRTFNFRSFALTALTASSLLLATSCQHDKDQPAPDDIVSAEDHGAGDEENALTADLISAAGPQDEMQSGSATLSDAQELARVLPACASRTYVAETRTLTIDFGAINCLCRDGRYRRGKIVVVFTGADRHRHSGAVATRVNYFVNDNQHTGTRIFTAKGTDGSFTLDVQNASIITPEGTHSWASHREYTRTAGFGTPQISDDAYTVSGTAEGTNRRGVSYMATIGQPLLKVFTPGCARHFIAGTVNISNSKSRSVLLNYDPTNTQACDNIASVTINGKTRLITLR